MKLLTSVVSAAILFAILCPPALAGLIASSGQSIGGEKVTDAEAQDLTEQAIDQALKNFGAAQPKLVLVFENFGRRSGMMKGLAKVGDIPMIGVYTGGYPTLGLAGFPERGKKTGIIVMALGGDVEIQTATLDNIKMPIKDWEWKKQKNPDGTPWSDEKIAEERGKSIEQHQAWGEELAGKLQVREGKTNLFLQLGCQHVPRMTWITDGCKKVFPASVHYIGIAAADHGGVYTSFKDYKGDRLLGIMISGDFDVAEAGSAAEIDKKQVDQLAVWREKIEQTSKELGGKPDAAFIVGCAGWHNKLEEKCAITNELLGGVPVFGAFGGGEIGHYKTGDGVTSLAGHYFVTLVKNR